MEETEVVEQQSSNETKQEEFDYRKAREERIIRNTEKRILKDLGADSFDDVKERLKQNINMSKELETQKDNGRKLSVFSAGFDDQFVDFVAHEVNKLKKEDENFEDALQKYKKNHSQFLRNTKIQMSTSPDFESKTKINSNHDLMNELIRGKHNKIF